MLERYFTKPDTLDRIRACWLGEQIEAYASQLEAHGHAAKIIRSRVPLLRHFGEFAWANGARFIADLPPQIDLFITKRVARSARARSTDRLQEYDNETRGPIEQFLARLLPDFVPRGRSSRLPFEPLAAFVPGFFDYLRKERGLRESTIRSYRHTLARFETYLARLEIRSPGELSAPVLSGFVTTLARQDQGPSSMTAHCSVTRVFLRYALREGLLTRDLTPAVGTVQCYRLAKVPRSITWAEVGLMLDSVERRSSTGKRDYALLLLLVSYGLRAREVAALTLDDIDWERDRLLVPERKAGHCTAYPLSRIVGEALCIYLEQARPRTEERILFRRAYAPYVAMTHHSVSSRAVHYLRKAGIKVHRPGSHTLRHTCVQRLIDADFSLKSAGDYVGHGSPQSTEIYTKIDVEKLRTMAFSDGEDLL